MMRRGWLSGGRRYAMNSEIAGIKEDLSDIMERMSRVTSAAGDGMRNRVSSLAEGRDRVSDRAHSMMEHGREWLDTADHGFRHGVKHTRETVRENPLSGIAIAAGIGFLLGLSTRLR